MSKDIKENKTIEVKRVKLTEYKSYKALEKMSKKYKEPVIFILPNGKEVKYGNKK